MKEVSPDKIETIPKTEDDSEVSSISIEMAQAELVELIDKLQRVTLKKQNNHSKHVFNFLEKEYGVIVDTKLSSDFDPAAMKKGRTSYGNSEGGKRKKRR